MLEVTPTSLTLRTISLSMVQACLSPLMLSLLTLRSSLPTKINAVLVLLRSQPKLRPLHSYRVNMPQIRLTAFDQQQDDWLSSLSVSPMSRMRLIRSMLSQARLALTLPLLMTTRFVSKVMGPIFWLKTKVLVLLLECNLLVTMAHRRCRRNIGIWLIATQQARLLMGQRWNLHVAAKVHGYDLEFYRRLRLSMVILLSLSLKTSSMVLAECLALRLSLMRLANSPSVTATEEFGDFDIFSGTDITAASVKQTFDG